MAVPTLEGLAEHLNIDAESPTQFSAELTRHLAAGRLEVEHRCGPLEPKTVTGERHYADSFGFQVSEVPLIAVTAVSSVYPVQAVDLVAGELDIDPRSGKVRRGSVSWLPRGRVSVTYSAGHDPCPDDLEIAVYVAAAHLWRTQRSSGTARSGLYGLDTDDPQGAQASFLTMQGFALPRRAMELMRPYLKTERQ